MNTDPPLPLLPPQPAPCQECAAQHGREEPHNRDALFYQLLFQQRTGRWPTWSDAMAHCPVAVQDAWRALLAEHGMSLET
jgi:hypothetical protein